MAKRIAVIVTGDRNADYETWRTVVREALTADRYKGRTGVLIHGAARGIDWIAGKIGGMHGWEVVPVPAQWDTQGRSAGPRRNSAMLSMLQTLQAHGYEVEVLAFHDRIRESRGTKDMVNLATASEVPVRVYMSRGGGDVLSCWI